MLHLRPANGSRLSRGARSVGPQALGVGSVYSMSAGRNRFSILRGPLDAVDDEHVHRAFCRFQLESKLFLNGRED
jgi:hypothetical protein